MPPPSCFLFFFSSRIHFASIWLLVSTSTFPFRDSCYYPIYIPRLPLLDECRAKMQLHAIAESQYKARVAAREVSLEYFSLAVEF